MNKIIIRKRYDADIYPEDLVHPEDFSGIELEVEDIGLGRRLLTITEFDDGSRAQEVTIPMVHSDLIGVLAYAFEQLTFKMAQQNVKPIKDPKLKPVPNTDDGGLH